MVSNKNVLVVGAGISGIGAAQVLCQNGANVYLLDGNTEITIEQLKEKVPSTCDAKLFVGDIADSILSEIEMAVLSPGVPIDGPLALRMKSQGILVIGEIELAYMFEKGTVLAITGTNGKTTTTALLGKIMQEAVEHAFVVGNIGVPYTKMVEKTSEDSVTVAEISSFQLETVHAFHPQVSAILNITPDHLNRHHTMDCYVETKEKISVNQTKDQFCVLNYEDVYCKEFGKRTTASVVYFASAHILENGYYLKDNTIFFAKDGVATKILSMEETNLLGVHNSENIMAAVAMAHCYGIDFEQIKASVCSFKAVEHRIEFVATKNGVDYYNDSKGTNPDAAIKGICAMTKPTYLIGGGYDKDSEYDQWIESFGGKVKKLILLGQTREKIAKCAKYHGFTDYIFVESLEEAVEICFNEAKAGDAVLLSPACASWGMFPNYEVRGNIFKELVNQR